MVKTKVITIKKRGGGTRRQKVQVLRSGKFKFIKNSGRVGSRPKRVKTKSRTVSKVVRRKARRRSTSTRAKLIDLEAMIYGGVRQPISDIVRSTAGKIPFVGGVLGGFGDEVAMGVANWLVIKKRIGGSRVQAIAKKGLVVENARFGAQVVGGGLNLLTRPATAEKVQSVISPTIV